MNVLVACEESQRVCLAFRAKGHNAFSCDILPCSGGHPEYHIQGDVLPLLSPGVSFRTCDGIEHFLDKWDMLIAFPPCTYLTNAGMCNLNRRNVSEEYKNRRLSCIQNSVDFVKLLWSFDCNKVAIENPVGVLSTHFIKPTQIIHPYEFGTSVNKRTCLWLRGLPLLSPTDIVPRDEIVTWGNNKKISKWYRDTLISCRGDLSELSKIRSKTFPGVAKAMAEQWG